MGPRPEDSHPPRPELIIRVGLTGHRWDKLRPADRTNVTHRLDEVFNEIEKIAARLARTAGYAATEDAPAPVRLRLLTGLAEGADRIGADLALLRPGPWELQALLPFAEADYRTSFFPENSRQPDDLPPSTEHFNRLLDRARASAGVQVLNGPKEDLAAPYLSLGIALALNSDVLIAVWDGMRGDGPGGTEYNINLANSYGIPIVHILAVGTAPPVVYLPAPNGVARVARLEDALEPRLQALLMAPVSPHRPPARRERPDLRETYFGEQANVVPGKVESVKQSWRKRWSDAGVSEVLTSAILATPLPLHYAWASELAGRHARRYRAGYRRVYALAPLAVFASAAALVLGTTSGNHLAVIGLAFLEVILLGWVSFTVWKHRRSAIHDRWLDYRTLAERIRLLPMVLSMGRSPVLRVRPSADKGSRDTWVDWLFRAIVRETGVLPVDLAAQIGAARALVVRGEVPDQIAYHRRTTRRLDRTERRLRWLRDWSFAFGALLAIVNLALLSLDEDNAAHIPLWLTGIAEARALIPEWVHRAAEVLALTLPAVGAAAQGFRSQGEFEDTARRSERVGEELEAVQRMTDAESVGATLDEMGAITSDVVGIMASEQSAWFEAYETKVPEAP